MSHINTMIQLCHESHFTSEDCAKKVADYVSENIMGLILSLLLLLSQCLCPLLLIRDVSIDLLSNQQKQRP